MGPLTQLLEMIPGMGKALRDPQMKEALEGDQMKMTEAIILSMTLEERRNPDILNGSRKRRIAARQRHDAAGRQPAAHLVQAVAEDDEAGDGHAESGPQGAARHARRDGRHGRCAWPPRRSRPLRHLAQHATTCLNCSVLNLEKGYGISQQ